MRIKTLLLFAVCIALFGCGFLPRTARDADAGERYIKILSNDSRIQQLLVHQPRKSLRGGYDGYAIYIIHTGDTWTTDEGEIIHDNHFSDKEVDAIGAIAVDVARKINFRKKIIVTDSDVMFHGHSKTFYP